jgi:uncharacterized protein YqeY
MLRTELNDALKQALKSRDHGAAATLRLVLAALKDRDIAARGEGNAEGIGDDQIRQMLQKMVRQSREAAETYDKAGRGDLAEKERQEIAVIERFLPKQLGEAETRKAVEATIAELGAESIKDMGRVMTRLREQYAGRMDFSKASAVAKDRLA